MDVIFLDLLYLLYIYDISPFDNFYTTCIRTVCCSHLTTIVHQLTCFCKSQLSPYVC